MAVEVNLDPYYQRIEHASSLDELGLIAADIKALGLGEPARTELNQAYKAKHAELSAPQLFPAGQSRLWLMRLTTHLTLSH